MLWDVVTTCVHKTTRQLKSSVEVEHLKWSSIWSGALRFSNISYAPCVSKTMSVSIRLSASVVHANHRRTQSTLVLWGKSYTKFQTSDSCVSVLLVKSSGVRCIKSVLYTACAICTSIKITPYIGYPVLCVLCTHIYNIVIYTLLFT